MSDVGERANRSAARCTKAEVLAEEYSAQKASSSARCPRAASSSARCPHPKGGGQKKKGRSVSFREPEKEKEEEALEEEETDQEEPEEEETDQDEPEEDEPEEEEPEEEEPEEEATEEEETEAQRPVLKRPSRAIVPVPKRAATKEAGPKSGDNAIVPGNNQIIMKEDEAITLLEELGVDVKKVQKLPLAEKVKAYVKCLVEQPVEKVKQMNVKVLFNAAEMSALWNFMKRWVAKASPETKKKWQALKDMPARGAEAAGKNAIKLQTLNLALVRRDWEELMATDNTSVYEDNQQKMKAKWRYHGEIEQEMGIRQANAFIDKGKFEKGEDSDGDSVYRKISMAEEKTTGRKRTISTTKTARVAKVSDLDMLESEADKMFAFDNGITKRKPKALKNGEPLAVGDRPGEEKGGGMLALLDAAVPPDDSVTGDRSLAASKGKSMSSKLTSKAEADVQVAIEGLRKLAKTDNASAVYLNDAKELKTHMIACARALLKKSRADLEKLDTDGVKGLTVNGAEHLEAWKQLYARCRPILKPKTKQEKPEKTPSHGSV